MDPTACGNLEQESEDQIAIPNMKEMLPGGLTTPFI